MFDCNYIFELVKFKICSSEKIILYFLAVLHAKLRTGLFNGVLSILYNIWKILISFSVLYERQALIDNFFPLHFGIENFNQNIDYWKTYESISRKIFFPDDDNHTVIFIANNTFSLHKGKPLVKSVMFVYKLYFG